MTLYKEVPKNWSPTTEYRDLLAKRAPAASQDFSETGEVFTKPMTPEALAAAALVKAEIEPSHFSGSYLDAKHVAIGGVTALCITREADAQTIMQSLDKTKASYHFSRAVLEYALQDAAHADEVVTSTEYDVLYGQGSARRDAATIAEHTRQLITELEGEQ